MCRIFSLPGENSFRLLGYWLGSFLRETEWGENFPELAEKGPVSHILLNNFPMHQIMLENFLEALGRGEIREGNVKTVTSPSTNLEWRTY